ncbi:hypothetical protein BH20CHL2_BH20CHL2_12340 [soil metagenome]
MPIATSFSWHCHCVSLMETGLGRTFGESTLYEQRAFLIREQVFSSVEASINEEITFMSQAQFGRRKFVSIGAVGVAATAIGISAVVAQDDDDNGTPVATSGTAGATPGATPGASPMASPEASGTSLTVIGIDIAYEQEELTIPADTDIEITFVNEGALEHNFVVEDSEFATEVLAGGEEETITVNLTAGEYIYFCSVPGHRAAGMEGTLTVE